jgi:hypothetical protein
VEFTAQGTALKTVSVAKLHFAWGIAVDGHGNVYMTGTEGLVKVSPAGHIVARSSAIVPLPATYVLPSQPAVDTRGNVYAMDRAGNILKISATGRLLGVIVKHGSGIGAVQQPVGLAVDSGGHLFVGETGQDRIKEFSLSGNLLAIWTP